MQLGSRHHRCGRRDLVVTRNHPHPLKVLATRYGVMWRRSDAVAAAAAAVHARAPLLSHQGSRVPQDHRVASELQSKALAGRRADLRSPGKPFAAHFASVSLHSDMSLRILVSPGTMS